MGGRAVAREMEAAEQGGWEKAAPSNEDQFRSPIAAEVLDGWEGG